MAGRIGTRAATCLEEIGLEGDDQVKFYRPNIIRALAFMFPNVDLVCINYKGLNTASVMSTLKAFPRIEHSSIASHHGHLRLSEGIVAACMAALHTHAAQKLLVSVRCGSNRLKGCKVAWESLREVNPVIGACQVSLDVYLVS